MNNLIKFCVLISLLCVSGCATQESPSTLRTDLSATVTYVGKHDEIVLDCTNMYGSFGNRKTKKREAVAVPSVRDDGRIVVGWGPDYNSKQTAELGVGSEIPADGPSVIVDVTLTDDGATYSIRQE